MDSGFTGSLWSQTARAAVPTNAIEGNLSCDVVVIGGGFTGLRAAIELAQRGTDVILLEAGDIGAGASGRNGGQVNPMLPVKRPEDLRRVVGDTYFERMTALSLGSADALFDFVRAHDIECDARQHGWLRVDHSAKIAPDTRAAAEAWNAHGAGFEFATQADVIAMSGARGYGSGVVAPRGGAVHPLSLVREMARVAAELGVRVHSGSRVLSAKTASGGWDVVTGGARVKTTQIIVATNGYTDDLVPKLKRSVWPLNSIQMATEPLSDDQIEDILPQGHTISDTRRLIIYARREPDNRVLFGGIGYRKRGGHVGGFEWTEHDARKIFPSLGNARFTHHWHGLVALNDDRVPHLHEPAPGMIAGLGYNGRGVAMSQAMGKVMADRALGVASGDLPFPVTAIKRKSWREVQTFGARIAMQVMRWRDEREARVF